MRDLIRSLAEDGHRVELHLHPHWLDAVRDGGQWDFPSYRRYRLHTLAGDAITDLFVSGAQALNEAAGGGYRTVAFRAGGYCVTPFPALAEGFRKAGIRIDSSIAKGFVYRSESHDLDFRSAPSLAHYRFGEDPLVPDPAGEFLEMPIATFRKNFFDKLKLKAAKARDPEAFRPAGDGRGMILENLQVRNRALRALAPAWEMFSLDSASRGMFAAKAASDPREFVTVVSHPKMLMPESYRTIEALADAGYRFRTLAQAAEAVTGTGTGDPLATLTQGN
jgi:hypothetical protein